MNDLTLFKACCLESYRLAHGISGAETVQRFQRSGVLDYLREHYDTLHTQGENYLVKDIDGFIANHPAT